jgi:isoleucyl-tRNA synthetase
MNELLAYAPTVISDKITDIFDFTKYKIPTVEFDVDETYLLEAKERFNESIESLKKDKTIKSTLELVIYTNSEEFNKLTSTEAEDWFVVSRVIHHTEDNKLAIFEVDGDIFEVYNAMKSKCPRCWKYRAKDEKSLCHRCESVVN